MRYSDRSIGEPLVFEISTNLGWPPLSVPSTTSEMISCAWAEAEERARKAVAPKSFKDFMNGRSFEMPRRGGRDGGSTPALPTRNHGSVLSPGGWIRERWGDLKDIRGWRGGVQSRPPDPDQDRARRAG